MSRVACSLVLLVVCSEPARGADLPPGALARLGDDRFRAGGEIEHLALSPDGKQFATVRKGSSLNVVVTVWDALTGRPLYAWEVNAELFQGLVWASGGASAIVTRAERGRKPSDPGRSFPDDFHVWAFADPTAAAPPALSPNWNGNALFREQPKDRPRYADFCFSADGWRVAAEWESANRRHAVHVFDLKPVDTVAKLTQVGTIDLGARVADRVRLSADGRTVVTFQWPANGDEMIATAWDVATGKPARPVLTPFAQLPILTPDARALIVRVVGDDEWGFDRFDLVTGKRRELVRWRIAEYHDARDAPDLSLGGFAFTPSAREFVVAVGRQTFVLDIVTGKELGRLEGHADALTAVAVSADGTRIATADESGLVRLWDAKTFRPVNDARGHRVPVEHAELSPDGKRLLTWAGDETVRLWDVATGKELRAFARATGDSRPVFASDGTAVVYSNKKSLIARDLQTGLEVPLPNDAKALKPRATILSTERLSAGVSDKSAEIHLYETASTELRRTLRGHRGSVRVLGFTPDGTKLLTAGGDHTVLVWDMRLQSVPLPDAVKKETNAAKLWDTLATGKAEAAYLAMARLSREPDAALKLIKMKLKPAEKGDAEKEAAKLTDCRAIELLEALSTDESIALLKELAGGHATAFRTQEAKRARERHK